MRAIMTHDYIGTKLLDKTEIKFKNFSLSIQCQVWK